MADKVLYGFARLDRVSFALIPCAYAGQAAQFGPTDV